MQPSEALCHCGGRLGHRGRHRGPKSERSSTAGKPPRRFTDHTPPGNPDVLSPYHRAALDGTTRFLARRRASAGVDRLLIDGANNRKIGGKVFKGALRGVPVFTLTLEERATCPRSCRHWLDCYGNVMNWPNRIQPDRDLTILLSAELRKLCARHERILVRLHVLGDFFSVPYVAFWRGMLDLLPGLHVYGYTARVEGPIAREIAEMNRHPRCWIRFSDGRPGTFRTVSIDTLDECPELSIVCPVQTGKTDCCGSCSLCWATDKPIAFLRH